MNYKRYKDVFMLICGSAIFSSGVIFFLQPLNIYSGGLLGFSQIIRDLLFIFFNFKVNVDLAGIINLLLNIFVLAFALKKISKKFIVKTIIVIFLQSIFLTIFSLLPLIHVSDHVVNIAFGSILVAAGTVMAFNAGGSGGGLDVIGIYLNNENKSSISEVYLIFNVFIYILCLFIYDTQSALYSIVHALFLSFLVKKIHQNNTEVQVMIITSEPELGKIILSELNRGVTRVQGIGEYTENEKFIYISVITKDKLPKLRNIIKTFPGSSFSIINNQIEVIGNFEKRII